MDYREIGRVLRQAREAHQMTQGEVGAVIGVTGSAIARMESGERAMPLHKLRVIAAHLDMDLIVTIEGGEGDLARTLQRLRTVWPRLPGDKRETLDMLLRLWEEQQGATGPTLVPKGREGPGNKRRNHE